MDQPSASVEQEHLLFAMKSAGIGVWNFDIEKQEIWVDEKCRELFGFAIDEVVSYQEALKFTHPEDMDRVNAAVQSATAPGSDGNFQCEFRILRPDDRSIRTLTSTGKAYQNAAGTFTRFSGVVRDITEKYDLRKRVSEYEQIAGLALESSDIGWVKLDLVAQQFTASKKYIEHVTGNPHATPTREQLMSHYYPEDLSLRAASLDALEKTGILNLTARMVWDDGSIHWIKFTGKHSHDSNGKADFLFATSRDITPEVTAQDQLKSNETILRSAIEVAELAVWDVELPSGKINLSPKLKSWLGMSPETTMQESLKLVSAADRERVQTGLVAAMRKGKEGFFDEEFAIEATATRGKKIIHLQGRTLFNEAGEPYRMNGIARDITPQRQLQLELEQQVSARTASLNESNQQLLRSNEELSQFAYVASHDLQEPLRKIKVYSGMLDQKAQLNDDGKQLLEKINSSTDRMSLLIKDLLNFSGLLAADSLWTAVNLNAVMKMVRRDFEVAIEEKRAKLFVGELPVVEGINVQLSQLFFNLLSNALKFARKEVAPEITVISMRLSAVQTAKVLGEEAARSTHHCIAFSDNGIGFEAEYANKIFDIFKRLHGRAVYPGSGIGLALCKKIVANHRGYIYAQSDPGESSTFYIILPEKVSEV